MARILILMSTRTYRAEAFLRAAARLGVAVTVGTEIDQPVVNLTAGASVALDLRHPRRAVGQIMRFAQEYPLEATRTSCG